MVFPALEEERPDAQFVSQAAGSPDLFPIQPEPSQVVVFRPALAEQAVLGTVVGEFQYPLEIHFSMEYEIHGLLGPSEQLGPEQRIFRQQKFLIFLLRQNGIFLQLIHQIHDCHLLFLSIFPIFIL